jgi:hypothetical protein
MGTGKEVIAPDGSRWRVRRRWLEQPLPALRKRLRERRADLNAGDALDALWFADGIDSVAPAVAIGIFAVLVVVVVLPLLGVAIELLVLLVLLGAGVFSRVVLRRPWVVEAQCLDDGGRSIDYAVPGWRASSRAIEELRRTIAAAGPPERV